jgi:hypothetical protein
MARDELKKLNDIRTRFKGTFERYGIKTNWNGYPEKTILLKNISNSAGRNVTDHLWFNLTKGFESLGELEAGDIVSFDARVSGYAKGYVNHREGMDERQWDYKLSFPTKIAREIGK